MKRQPLRLAGLRLPSQIEDGEARKFFIEAFGAVPVLTIPVTDEALRYIVNCKAHEQAFSAALRASDAACLTAVLMLQFRALQLRCIVSLAHPVMAELLDHAAAAGHVNVLLGNQEGEDSALLRPSFDEFDLVMLTAAVHAQEQVAMEQRISDATITAADCRDVDELPSLLSGVDIDRVDVSVVPLAQADCLPGTDEERKRGGNRFNRVSQIGQARGGHSLH